MAGPLTTTFASTIEIREIDKISEMRAVEGLQKEVWGVADREVLPALVLIPMIEVGAVLLGAFSANELVGFVFGFPGIDDGRLILHSDMLAVKPGYRAQGLGYRLKLAQRNRALAKGIDTISWTFDPLQSANAHLNFAKLGVVANRYQIDYYGETSSFLHTTGTDRLWVMWNLNSERVRDRLSGTRRQPNQLSHIPRLVSVGGDNAPVSTGYSDTESALVEIPQRIDSLVETTPELALLWRKSTRAAFTATIDAGMVVEEFFPSEREGLSVGTYLLKKSGG